MKSLSHFPLASGVVLAWTIGSFCIISVSQRIILLLLFHNVAQVLRSSTREDETENSLRLRSTCNLSVCRNLRSLCLCRRANTLDPLSLSEKWKSCYGTIKVTRDKGPRTRDARFCIKRIISPFQISFKKYNVFKYRAYSFRIDQRLSFFPCN